MKKFGKNSIFSFIIAILLLFTILAMAGSAWAQNQDAVTAATNQQNQFELRQEAVTLSQPGIIKFLSGPNAGEPLDIALNFIRDNREALGLSAADLADFTVTSMYQSEGNGVTHIYLRQRYKGIELYGADLNINIAADGSVINMGSYFASNVATGIKNDTPALTAVAATEAAAQHLGLDITQPLAVEQSLGGTEQATVLSDGGISINAIPARLMYQAHNGNLHLTWDLIIYQLDTRHWWNLRVDATTGEVVDKFDYVVHDDFLAQAKGAHGAATTSQLNAAQNQSAPNLLADTYRVYGWPIESPNYALPAPPADARTSESNPAGDAVPNAHPFGWHSDNVTSWTDTQGNNVDAHKGATRYDCGATLDCNTGLDLTMEPTVAVNVDAATVNLFYWNNIIHDVWYQYGFDEASGNFQNNNNGQGGAGNDRVNANAQAPGNCNANFGTPSDGSQPTMNMFICTNTTPARDGDLDNLVIVHEYGHGISNRLTGGPVNVSCLGNSEQMGEGWSDWLGLMMTIESGDTGVDPRGVGTWLFGEGPGGPGIRPTPYSTNFGVNPTTYGNIGGLAIPHGVGYAWATIIWEMNWELIANGVSQNGLDLDIYNGTGGNNLAMQLVMDGMKLQPCSPGFVDGRDAILLADVTNNAGANQCTIWSAFARRGLGFSASQGSSGSTGDGTEAFDMPISCQTVDINPTSQDICAGSDAVYIVDVGASYTPPVAMSASGQPAGSTATFSPNPVPAVPSTTDLTIGNTAGASAGSYTIVVTGTDGITTGTTMAGLEVYAAIPGASPTLNNPANGATDVALAPTFTWNATANATGYFLEVADDVGFTNIVYSATETTTSHDMAGSLSPITDYYWRVSAQNPCGNGAASSTFSFTTGNIICTVYDSTDVPKPIPATGTSGTTISTLNIPDFGPIEDVNVLNLIGTHTFMGDLEFYVESPTATSVQIRDNVCGTAEDFDINYDDEAAPGAPPCPPTDGNSYQPFSPLSAFDGEETNGTWTLRIEDLFGGDSGTLNSWSLEVCYIQQSVGTLDGNVTADESSAPLEGALVEADNGSNIYSANTDVNGDYSIPLPAGNYDVTASATNRLSVTASGVSIISNTTTIQDFSLAGGLLSYSPPAIEEFMEIGDVVTNTVTVTNSGALTIEWSVDIGNFGGPALLVNNNTTKISMPASDGNFPRGAAAPSMALAPATEKAESAHNAANNLSALLGGSPAYGVDLLSDSFNSFTTNDPSNLTVISGAGGGALYNGDFIGGDFSTLYAIDTNTSNLLAIDTATGGQTVIGSSAPTGGQSWAGMAGDPSSGAMYGLSTDCNNNTLYTIDLGTAALTTVGTATGFCIIDIAVNAAGEMYGMDIIGDLLVSIDKVTGAITTIGSTGFDANFAQGMDFDEGANILYIAAYNNAIGAAELRIADTATGATALVGNIGAGSGVEMDSFAVATGGGSGNWPSAVPSSGSIPPFSVSTFDVVFDSRSLLDVGTYTADLTFDGTYVNSVATMPLTMHLSCPTCGFLNGSITDAFTNLPLPADIHVTDAGGFDVTFPAVTSYSLAIPAGDYDITASSSDYFSETASVTLSVGVTTTQDFALVPIFGELVNDPTEYDVTVALGFSQTLPLDLTNIGTIDVFYDIEEQNGGYTSTLPLAKTAGEGEIVWLYRNTTGVAVQGSDSGATVAYPGAYKYVPANAMVGGPDVLVYTDDWIHTTPNTLVQDALTRLGLAATVHVDSDYAGFETSLTTGGPWDLVIWSGENFQVPATTVSALLSYVQGGGKLAATYWRQLDYPADPLWAEMGFSYISNYVAPEPTYWWDTGHPLFNNPESAPEWLNRIQSSGTSQGTRLEPLSNGVALAGYTTTPAANEAAIVLRDDGFTLYKGLRDVSTNADDDTDTVLDGTELWENIITGLLNGFGGGEIPWLHQDPISDTVAAMSTNVVDITFDATVITQTGQYFGTMLVTNDAHDDLIIPVTMTVVLGVFDVNLSLDEALSGDPGTTVTYTVSVENLGNVLDSYDLAISGSTWSTTLSDASVTLADGESTTVMVTVDVPGDAAGGDMDMVTVTATSQSDAAATDTTNLTTTANAVYGVVVASDDAATGNIGGSVTYQVWVTNTGNTTDTFDVTVSGHSWTTTADSPVTLASGDGAMVMVTVDIPGGAASGDMDVATVTATSQGDTAVSGSVNLTTTAEGFFIYLPFVVKN